jgi:regulator of sirC expression with transglutaminase-like and TPR domain
LVTVYPHRGLARARLGNPREAREDLDHFLEVAPYHDHAQQARDLLASLAPDEE